MFRPFTIIILFLSVILFINTICALDLIHDEYVETNQLPLHSKGLLSYGAHTNTFHLRFAYLRYNIELSDLQFSVTLYGNKDTHEPETEYGAILDNITLYDYGVRYLFLDNFYLALRGAAVFQKNSETLLIIPHTYSSNNPAEFDTPKGYTPNFLNAAGVRLGYLSDSLEVAYSQGDFRHSIPMAFLARYRTPNFTARALLQIENGDPLVYAFSNYTLNGELSLSGGLDFGDWGVKGIAEVSLHQYQGLRFRLEEGLYYYPLGVSFAMRQILTENLALIADFSLQKQFYGMASLGVFASLDGRVYVATLIDF